jgi:hypothetical protein
MKELHILQVFWEYQAIPIPPPYEPVVKFYSKMGIKFIFHVFYEELLHVAMWLKLPRG